MILVSTAQVSDPLYCTQQRASAANVNFIFYHSYDKDTVRDFIDDLPILQWVCLDR